MKLLMTLILVVAGASGNGCVRLHLIEKYIDSGGLLATVVMTGDGSMDDRRNLNAYRLSFFNLFRAERGQKRKPR